MRRRAWVGLLAMVVLAPACGGRAATAGPPPGTPTATAFQPAQPSPRPRATDLGPDLVATLANRLAGSQFAQTADGSSGLADQLLLAVNRRRVIAGYQPLQSLPELTRISQLRVEDMIVRGYFGHTDPVTGADLASPLLKSEGFIGRVAENLFYTDAPADQVIDQVTGAWFDSPGHRANLLDPDFRYTGLAVIKDGSWWRICQLFAQRAPR